METTIVQYGSRISTASPGSRGFSYSGFPEKQCLGQSTAVGCLVPRVGVGFTVDVA